MKKKYKDVVRFIESDIQSGRLKKGDRCPSVNALKIRFGISRSSVFLAMDELKSRGIIEAEPAVGHFVASEQIDIKDNVLLLFNEVNSFKEKIWLSFMKEIGSETSVDIMFHNYNRDVFNSFLSKCNGKYTCYIVMPGKFRGVDGILDKMSGKVILADHFHPDLVGKYSSVGQNFEMDTYKSLLSERERVMKYRRIILVQKKEKEPDERYDGILHFCSETGQTPLFVHTMNGMEVKAGDLLLTADDEELVGLLKYSNSHNMTVGDQFGIISYNDDPIKEILAGGITTISTDFEEMGRTLAHLVHDPQVRTIWNRCSMKIRKSM